MHYYYKLLELLQLNFFPSLPPSFAPSFCFSPLLFPSLPPFSLLSPSSPFPFLSSSPPPPEFSLTICTNSPSGYCALARHLYLLHQSKISFISIPLLCQYIFCGQLCVDILHTVQVQSRGLLWT